MCRVPVQLIHIHIEGNAPHFSPEYSKHIRDKSLFTGANAREAVADGRADYIPIFLSEIPQLFRRGNQKVDIALMSMTPADSHGYHRYAPPPPASC